MTSAYVGRFAPSPTGPLHFGSLVAALVSYLHARARGGRWLVRIEDLDPPREMPGAASLILKQLERHGLEWDGEVVYQSERHHRYREVVEALMNAGKAYYCNCSRKDIRAMGGRYNGHCRRRTDLGPDDTAVRIVVPEEDRVSYHDLFQGPHSSYPGRESGDFIIRRRDNYYAYQLAVVVDDMDQRITHVVRGRDLLETTPRQVWLFRQLGATAPVYGHVPLAMNCHGQKLSKQNHAPSLDEHSPTENLRCALKWLSLEMPADLGDPKELLALAQRDWHDGLILGDNDRLAPKSYF